MKKRILEYCSCYYGMRSTAPYPSAKWVECTLCNGTGVKEYAMEYKYIGIPVDTQTYDNTKIGAEFAGGVVIEGIYDDDNEQDILVVRINQPKD